MLDYYDAIYLSPHLDDAAMSCGGQIWQQTQAGQSVLVVTLMAGDPPATAVTEFAQSLHDRWQLVTEATALRRAEDITACHILGADYLHWPIPDCIYRVDPATAVAYYDTEEALFGPIHEQEAELITELATWMTQLPAAGRIYAPLTLGNHVDHQLTRLAAERCFATDLFYYEDYPYAANRETLITVIAAGKPDWKSENVHLNQAALLIKIKSIVAYQSQLSTFFEDNSDLQAQIMAYSAQVGGEQVWWQEE